MASVMEPMVENTVSKIRVSDEKFNEIEGLVSMVSSFRQEEKMIAETSTARRRADKVRCIMYSVFSAAKIA